MEFGDKEWLAKVEENYDFPVILAVYLSNKSKSINSLVVESKAQNVGGVKYSKVAPNYTLNGESLALLDVKRVHNSTDFFEWVKTLRENWV